MKTSRVIFFWFLCSFITFSGCRKFKQEKIVANAEPYRVTNLYPIERLPSYFNRVVVLPIYTKDEDSPLLAFADDIFRQEIIQQKIFETIHLSPSQMKSIFGKSRVSSVDPLPNNFLSTLEIESQANGVLFIEVLSFRPYRPISLSVRAKLVDIKTGELNWAVDEMIDAGHASVQVAAQRFQSRSQVRALSDKTQGSTIQSPRVFTKFAASMIFETLPNR